MFLFALMFRTGLFAEGRFLGKILDEWIADAQEFIHAKLPHLVVLLVVAFILSRIVTLAASRMIRVANREGTSTVRRAQVRTLAGILRNTFTAVLWGITALQVLTTLGVNLGPLLASAGIAGVAIGLAAQTIVKDILNGILILLEDQFDVGDTVRLTGMTGTVESMTLRRTEIRDGDGTLYIVPNSQITTVANLSRDFSVTTVNVSVDISASPDEVVPLLGSIATEIRKDPKFAALFLADPQVLGVDAIKGSEVVYPVVFKTLATQQYAPVREFRRRVRVALEEKGLLPGDPTRTFRGFTGKSSDETLDPTADDSSANSHQGQTPASHEAKIDPTTIPAITHDPFGSQ